QHGRGMGRGVVWGQPVEVGGVGGQPRAELEQLGVSQQVEGELILGGHADSPGLVSKSRSSFSSIATSCADVVAGSMVAGGYASASAMASAICCWTTGISSPLNWIRASQRRSSATV